MAEPASLLTERERQCLRLVHAHLSSKQIARELGIQPGTVDRHCENAVRKLQVESRVAAALALVGQEIGEGSQYELIPMGERRISGVSGGAERTPHDPRRRYDSPAELGRDGSHLSSLGHDRHQKDHGPAPDRGDAQAIAVHDIGWGDDRADVHRIRDARHRLQALDERTGRLGTLLVVLGVAAAAAWILTAVAGAEQFAFLLQHLRYSN